MDKEIYQDALNKWGIEEQVKQAIEELTELSLALQHHKKGKSTISDIVSEIADVEIMCSQLRLICGDKMVDNAKSFKLLRLRGRIDETK